jgi:coenzyme F420 hydrogenase subunit beta
MEGENIRCIVDNFLCTGCGACILGCPQGAISIIEDSGGFLRAKIDKALCINCAKCLDICPQFSFPQFNSLDDYLIGNYLASYIGHANSKNVREIGQSGGIATALLLYLLDSKKIDNVIVNRFNAETLSAEVKVSSTYEDVLNCAGSLYVQSSVLSQIDPSKKSAIVTLGCQSQGLSGLKRRKLYEPEYIIGLICAGNYSRQYIKAIIGDKYPNSNIESFRFRDKKFHGWPGDIGIYLKNGKIIDMNPKVRHKLKKVYECYHCLFCFDQMNIMSDLVIGDPWGIQLDRNDKMLGESIIVVRTKKGNELIEEAISKGYINVMPLQGDLIFSGQTVQTRHKKKVLSAKAWADKNNLAYPKALENKCFNSQNYFPDKDIAMRLKFSHKIVSISEGNHISWFRKLYLLKLQLIYIKNLGRALIRKIT